MNKRVAFIGHRNILLNISDRIIETIEEEIKNGNLNFIMGSHGDFDNICLNCCRFIRNIHKNIKIEVVLTSIYAVDKYNQYNDVKSIVFDIENIFYKNRILESNRKMIEQSDVLICYVDERRSNSCSKDIMNFAKKRGLKIINLFNPEDLCNNSKDSYYKSIIEKIKTLPN